MSAAPLIDQRLSERLLASEMTLRVFLNGHQIRTPLIVLDYNRDGIAFISSAHLGSRQNIRLSLALDDHQVGPVEATVHNCRKLKTGDYRCGIQFRADSPKQLDRKKIMIGLELLENTLRINQGYSNTILS